MKRRHHIGRRTGSRQKPLPIFASRKSRKRKSFTFERLEDRLAFSASPVEAQAAGLSNATLEGAAAIWLQELQWAAYQAADATNSAQPQYTFLALPNDPMFENQWHLWNTGQQVGNPDLQNLFGIPGEDINVLPVWQGTGLERAYTGAGVTVAVFDTGIQLTHPDLHGNIHPTLRYNATTGTTNATPDFFDPSAAHGTAVAGLIGAVWNNEEGGTGVAPGVTLVPIRRDFQFSTESFNGFQWVNRFDLDITNNSWGPNHAFDRAAFPLSPEELTALRNSVIFGRDGLGIIHVFSSGNDGGPGFSPGFGVVGNYDSSSYNPWVNSRFTIGVTGVDHDGLYFNYDENGIADGTFTTYPTAGPSVLVAAPTGSNGAITVAEDDGFGSGLWTTDLVGDFGLNAEPDAGGFDPDQDFWFDANYTSRFNGTSAAAPLVSGVIALMLEANPNLTYRDVQNILVRTARQNAQFEYIYSPGAPGVQNDLPPQNSWQVNQIGPFRAPDPWTYGNSQASLTNPLATPNPPFFVGQIPPANPQDPPINLIGPDPGFGGGGPTFWTTDTNDFSRQFRSHYEAQPPVFTNGAGFTVSQGYGLYGEQIGYGHGMIDAALAVAFAEKWHTLGQNVDRQTERTFTTGPVGPGQGFFNGIPAAEQMPAELGALVVPGGFGPLDGGFIGYWNEYFADFPPGPFDPTVDNPPIDWPSNGSPIGRGASYMDFAVPPAQGIDVEWVEVKVDIAGPVEDLDFLRIFLVSPDGTQSELNNFYLDPAFTPNYSLQPLATPARPNDPLGDIDLNGGNFTWTFSTNRHWGESSASSVIIDPVTGEPLWDEATGEPIFRNWELHIENYSNSAFQFQGVEVVWHGKPIAGGQLDANYAANGIGKAQRVQGLVGIDTNNDGDFNFNRYIQTVDATSFDDIRILDVNRRLDFIDVNGDGLYDPAEDTVTQEPFAGNILVEAFVVRNPGQANEFVEEIATARFLTGADGNYYFDLDPNLTYEIRASDLNAVPGTFQDHVFAPGTVPVGLQYQPHYLTSWRITPDWFYAPDRDVPLGGAPGDNPEEILFGMHDGNGDGQSTLAPKPFQDTFSTSVTFNPATGPALIRSPEVVAPIPMAVKNINFLIKRDAAPNQVVVDGTVYVDLDGNGTLTPNLDTPTPNVRVYYDTNGNGSFDQGAEPFVITSDTNTQAEFHFDFDTTVAAGVTVTAASGGNAAGSDGNGISVQLVEDGTVAGGVNSVSYNNATKVLTIRANFASGTLTNTEVAAAIDGHADFNAVATGTADTNLAANDTGGYIPTYTTRGLDVGMYSFTVDATVAKTVSIGIDPTYGPTAWEPSKAGGLHQSVIATPGDFPSIIDFFLLPPQSQPGSVNGNILGFVYNDLDTDGVRDAAELGVEGLLVFVDTNEDGIWNNNNDGIPDPGEEIGTFTTANGSFFLGNVPNGNNRVMLSVGGTTYAYTQPSNGIRQIVLAAGATRTGVLFGVRNLADRDWDDLPDSYSTVSGGSPAGPSHVLFPHFRLGSNISGEVNGQPSAGANLDTADDGVVLLGGTIQPGLNTVQVTVFGVGGSFTGWIDWNQDGMFTEGERVIWSTAGGQLLGGEADLTPGVHNLTFMSPGVDGQLAARFRWGEQGLSFTGAAGIGEVEGYRFSSSATALLAGDYNNDDKVDLADYLLWRTYLGTATVLPNDTTPGSVTQADYDVWRANFGSTSPAPAPAVGGAGESFDGGSSADSSSAEGGLTNSGPSVAVSSMPTQDLPPATGSESQEDPSSAAGAPAAAADPHSPAPAEEFSSGSESDVTGTLSATATHFASFTADVAAASSFAPLSSVARLDASVDAEQSATDLLLLDLALAELDLDDEEAPITDRFGHDEESVGELELAAVFEGEANWWAR